MVKYECKECKGVFKESYLIKIECIDRCPACNSELINVSMKYQEQEYFCNKCKRFHSKYRNNKIVGIYMEHYQYLLDITRAEAFKVMFRKSWKKQANKKKETSMSNLGCW